MSPNPTTGIKKETKILMKYQQVLLEGIYNATINTVL